MAFGRSDSGQLGVVSAASDESAGSFSPVLSNQPTNPFINIYPSAYINQRDLSALPPPLLCVISHPPPPCINISPPMF